MGAEARRLLLCIPRAVRRRTGAEWASAPTLFYIALHSVCNHMRAYGIGWSK